MTMKLKKHITNKAVILLATTALISSVLFITVSAAMLGSDTISKSIYGTTATGYLAVYDTYATATTSYARSGSNISISTAILATYRYGGSDITLYDYDDSMGGGATAKAEIPVSAQPNGVFLEIEGKHEVRNYVNGVLMMSGHWLDSTKWVR